MTLPFFYISEYSSENSITLDEDTSRHIVQVLRMGKGEKLNLTDGKGKLLTCEITDPHKKKCSVTVVQKTEQAPPARHISIAISILKNANRFEWFLEKATEIGVAEIIPLICERTEKDKLRMDRMQSILVSAMLQSQQCWLPELHEPVKFEDLAVKQFDDFDKLIAHCVDTDNKQKIHQKISKSSHHLICIGPEGDFTPKEIELAMHNGFKPVSLGESRLRTETAGVVAATLLSHI
ncbi:MAG TPA: RsmE family RNA methyltransferase [Chitinophagaceae bacterium]|nr:RsmE family RNA methyltransferase [Chitinophagaceae bacterium]